MGSVAIITANYGHFDEPRKQVSQDIDVDWICVTEDPDLKVPAPWVKEVRPDDGLHPCLAAKRFRTEPWKYWPHDHFIWLDNNMEVTSTAFAREALDCIQDGLATWKHPRRDCLYDEAEASVGAESQGGKYDAWPILEQAEHYRQKGHPEHWGLWATGTLAWDAKDKRMHKLGKEWLAECKRWSIQDQISFPYVCRKNGIRPGEFPFKQIVTTHAIWLQNPWWRLWPHLQPA